MNAPARYSWFAIAMHWLIALVLFGLLFVGFYMARLGDDELSLKFSLYQWHKSFGISLLLLTLVRLAWRWFHPPPPSLAQGWQRRAATVSHGLLYALTLAVPLAGWAMVSASPWNIPTVLFGLIPWPHLPPFDTLSDKQAAETLLKGAHRFLAYGAASVAALHILAALQHHFVLRDGTLARMMPLHKGDDDGD